MQTIDVLIMGREFRVACSNEEKPSLLRAVALVDEKMNSIRESGRVVGIDRIAVMAALQIAHQSMNEKKSTDGSVNALDNELIERKIQHMTDDIDQALQGLPVMQNGSLF